MTAAHDAFQIGVHTAGDAHVVSVRGEVDLDTAERFANGLRTASKQGSGPVLVDLCEVQFMDSTGLHLLLNLLRRLTRQHRRMVVACDPNGVRRLFEITRLEGTFELYGSREAALAALESGGGRLSAY